jgi:hypothetical protein
VSLTRRKLFGWVAALFGGAAVAKVAPVAAETPLPALSDVTRGKGGVEDVLRGDYWASDGMELARLQAEMDARSSISAAAWDKHREEHAQRMRAYLEQCSGINSVARGTHDVYPVERADGSIEHVRVDRVAGYVPPDEYVHGVTPGWTFRKREGDA